MFLGWRIVDMLGLSNFACHPRSLHRVRAQFVLADGARLLWIMGRTSELGRIMLADYAYSIFSVLSPSESQKFVVSNKLYIVSWYLPQQPSNTNITTNTTITEDMIATEHLLIACCIVYLACSLRPVVCSL